MRKALCLAASVAALYLAGCPTGGGSGPTLPTTTSGGGWFLSTGFISNDPPLVTYAPNTTISGTWVSDQPGAAGDASPWVVTTDDTGNAAIPNGRVPATWSAVWTASLSYPQCDNYTATLTPSIQYQVEELNCIETTLEAENSTFTVAPNPIYLANPPATTTIVGSGFSSEYGMPIVQYFSLQGTLLAQASATYVSSDGTTISANTPSLSGLPVGSYAGIISNIAANGTNVYAGAVSVDVQEEAQTATPSNSASVSVDSGDPVVVTYTLTFYDTTPGATIYYDINANGIQSVAGGSVSSGGTISYTETIFSGQVGGISGTMYATAPGYYTQSESTSISF